ncbi:hypothetical protein [Sphingomonas sp. R86521]|uniref:hypothetical protein n=1 Tax=Sphingomonas sp. R86521 TaxID=3093860 RepID=UPI0036D3F1CC
MNALLSSALFLVGNPALAQQVAKPSVPDRAAPKPRPSVDFDDTRVPSLKGDRRVKSARDKLVRAVEDFDGADPTSSAVRGASRYSEVVFTRQSYTLPTRPFAGGILLSGNGTNFIGKMPAGLGDTVSTSGKWQALYADAAGSAAVGSANENVAFDSMVVPATTSGASYQKNALYALVRTYDSSDYTRAVRLRDAVGLQAAGQIMPGNKLGRVWGAHAMAYIYPGADGYATALELELHNYGSAQPVQNTATSKNLMHIVAVGGPATAAIKLSSRDGGSFYTGLFADPTDVLGDFLLLRDRFAVNAKGQVSTAGGVAPFVSNTASIGSATVRFAHSFANEVMAVEHVTAGPTFRCSAASKLIVVNKAMGSPTLISLPDTPETGRSIIVKDGKGDAARNPVTVRSASGTIDGTSSYVISTDRGVVRLTYDGSEWLVL